MIGSIDGIGRADGRGRTGRALWVFHEQCTPWCSVRFRGKREVQEIAHKRGDARGKGPPEGGGGDREIKGWNESMAGWGLRTVEARSWSREKRVSRMARRAAVGWCHRPGLVFPVSLRRFVSASLSEILLSTRGGSTFGPPIRARAGGQSAPGPAGGPTASRFLRHRGGGAGDWGVWRGGRRVATQG